MISVFCFEKIMCMRWDKIISEFVVKQHVPKNGKVSVLAIHHNNTRKSKAFYISKAVTKVSLKFPIKE